MTTALNPRAASPRLALVALTALAVIVPWLSGADPAHAAVACPNPVPVLDENNCRGAGSTAWRMTNYSEDIGGFSTKTSFNKGESVPLKIARNASVYPTTSVDIGVYRMGHYGGNGGRLVHFQANVAVNNTQSCNAPDATTGKLDCGNWNVTHTVPAASLPASGVYIAKITTTATPRVDNHIVFVVRDDNRSPESKSLYVLPTASYQAYNNWGGKSLYFDKNFGPETVSGTSRAVKVSFNRPLDRADSERDRFLGPDFHLLQWLERNGYDASYTDDVQAHADAPELRQHKAVVIPGHSEYWSREQFLGVKAARDAGTHIASFSANTAYWKVRYENGNRTLVCYKTVQGDGSGGSGAVSANDWGPDGAVNTADDALGADGQAGTADDRPENSTTTFRDNGAPPGDLNAPLGGRVGPDMPENQLFGVMYVGDNDSENFPLTVPAGNGGAEFASDRVWRNTGIPGNSSTNIGANIVGWEWDAVPTQAQYTSRQPAGVKRLSATNVQTASDNSWLQDEGRARSTNPPPGQPGTVNAVKYTAPSGALVFASGSMHWAWGLSFEEEPRIKQATYNVLSDMGIQPDTPQGLTLDPAGSNQAPVASFTVSPNPVKPGQTVTFDGSASRDPDGSIARYDWDLDGNGSFETNSGTNPVVTRSYPSNATLDVRLRVTDQGAATDVTVRTLTVLDNAPPTASFTADPNPAVTNQSVSFNAGASADSDGTITKYEWDLDGNGSYETNGGASPTTSRAYPTAGTFTVGLRVTDNGGKTGTKTLPVTINTGGASNYGDAVLDTPGLLNYWRMGETTGTTFADSKGTNSAGVFGGTTLGVSGGPAGDPNKAARFDGTDDYARAALNLSGKSTITVEFWLKWNGYTNDDDLAMEFTDNFNGNDGGFLVDPNAPQQGGRFGVAIGRGGSRNNAFFARPSAGAWHHYALVLDTTAPGADQIKPYVDGQPVTFTKLDSGTGGGFANANLHFMSRAGANLFGAGDLDELAVYDRALSAATIAEHAGSNGTNKKPVARFTASPNPAPTGATVNFDASTSSDPDGSITKYEWDLDGNGSYETNTGTNPRTSRAYSAGGTVPVGLRVTDNATATATTTQALEVGGQPPTASFTANPNPTVVNQSVGFDASASSDPDGSITKYEWDLDGNGSYETDTGATKTTTRTYTTPGTVNVGLRVTDNEGKTATKTVPLTINSGGPSNYGDGVLETPGLMSYWRMGETAPPSLADSKGTNTATAVGGAAFGVPGGPSGDPNTAVSFDGTDDSASAPLNLSGTRTVTVEFWLKWDRYDQDDDLAFEFTNNFNANDGGFLVDPNAPQQSGSFGVAIGRGGARNNAFFARPSAGAWHHYALVLDSSAVAADQIKPYVDGQPVTFSKTDSGTGAGNFGNSTLYMMSRAGSALFGAGDLDEVAIYNRALSATTIADHASSTGTNRRPTASFSASPNPVRTGTSVNFDAAASSDPDGSVTKYEWDLDGNGSYETDTGATKTTTRTYTTPGTVTVGLRVTDDRASTGTSSRAVEVVSGPTASFTATPNPANAGQTVSFNAGGSSDPGGSITKYEWDLDGNGSYETDTGATATTSRQYTSPGTVDVGLRVTGGGLTGTTTRSLTVRAASYDAAVTATPGLVSYWRLEETTGTTFANSGGGSPATFGGGVTRGVPGALAGGGSKAARFDGVDDFARAPLNLSATNKTTVEFWLRWNGYADDDDLALELTDNFNANNGGLLVDPNSSFGMFAVGLGADDSRNTAFFDRPTAGSWHHVALVLDTTAAGADQIKPYVDGQPVTFVKTRSGTGAGNFANAPLSFMSRAGASLFGGGDLDELAIYDRALSAQAIADHYAAGS